MEDVLYVPNFRYKVISSSTASKKGWRFLSTRKCITASTSNRIKFIAERRENNFYDVELKILNGKESWTNIEKWTERMNYLFDIFKKGKTEGDGDTTEENSTLISASKRQDKLDLWHRRLGHPNFKKIIDMRNKGIVRGMEEEVFDEGKERCCDCCSLMKATRNKFNKDTRERAKNKLDVIHSDICGPISEKSLGGFEYILTFVDDWTRKSDVYLLRNKSEVLTKFKDYKARVERETGNTIKVLRSDNGGEFVNNAMGDFLRSEGIKHQVTTVYTPQQNGVAERLNRTLIEKTRCLLKESELPHYFWPEAVRTANRLHNHLPTKICGDVTPIELWLGRKPSIKYFRVFGCKVFVRIPRPYWTSKLSERAEQGIFLGYDENRKGSIIWIQDDQRMVFSRDVKFMESEYGWKGRRDDETEKDEEGQTSIAIFDFLEKSESAGNNVQQMNNEPEERHDNGQFQTTDESETDETDDDDGTGEESPMQNQPRYDLRPRTEQIKPEKYSMNTTSVKRLYTADELTAMYGPKPDFKW
jgi:transposase InsO family protein